MQTTDFIWFDGEMVPWNEAKVHVLSHCLHYGTGVFEGIRAYKCADGTSAVFRLKEHMKRYLDSAKIVAIDNPLTEEVLCKAVIDTLVANKLEEGYIRPLAFVGYGKMGVHHKANPVHNIIAVWPWGAYLGAEALEKGIRIKTSSYVRNHVNGMMSKSKASGNYLNSVLAKNEAIEAGYSEALLLDANGCVAEGSGENVFIINNGVIKTPPLTTVLGGLTRDSVITLAKDLGYTVVEQSFSRDEVYVADEAFFTGTAAEITPISSLDNRQIGCGTAGPITKILQENFFKILKGQNPEYSRWLTHYTV